MKMAFTTGLFVDIGPVGYDHRYCYKREADALADLLAWDGAGHPAGDWIKRKGIGSDLANPKVVGHFRGAEIVSISGS